jgi:23S rRNA pseudouridine1911/1915/1917 synthase
MADEFADDFIPETDEESSSDVVHFRWKVTKTLTRRLDQYLVDRVGYLSRAGVQRVIKEGLVTANGRIVKASYHPQNGDGGEMVAPPEPVNELVPEPIPLDIVYEDEHFLALNKQADLIVHPARGKWTGTLVNGLVHYGNQKGFSLSSGGVRPENLAPHIPGTKSPPPNSQLSTPNSQLPTPNAGNWRPGILHRLDRNTTGIMLIAKSDEAHWRIARQFENRTIQKTYLALCHGIPPQRSGIINAPIGKDKFIREKQAIRKPESGGKEAVTLFEVVRTFPPPSANPDLGTRMVSEGDPLSVALPSSLVKLTPKTGRTHQLRVHLSYYGNPILGDTIYGGKEIHRGPRGGGGGGGGGRGGDFHFTRQALHAHEITFTHPATLEKMTLQAPLPPDMKRLMELLGQPA